MQTFRLAVADDLPRTTASLSDKQSARATIGHSRDSQLSSFYQGDVYGEQRDARRVISSTSYRIDEPVAAAGGRLSLLALFADERDVRVVPMQHTLQL
jgi:hypothetical protein